MTSVDFTVTGPAGAPVLVLSNSLGTTRAMWDAQAAALAARFRVVTYDTRGHGTSPVPPGPYTIADLGTDVVELLDRLEVERAHVCGLSIGGMTALWLAAHAPERVDRLVVCCSSARPGNPETWRERAATVRTEGMEAVADAVVDRWITPAFAAAHPEQRAALRQILAATPPEGYASCCEVLAGLDLEPDLARIAAPTLVVSAAEDPALPPDHQERIAAGIPGARLESLSPAAHIATVEQPETMTTLITTHLTHGV